MKIINIINGLVISLLSIWITGYFFCRNYVPIEYNHDLKRNIYRPGIVINSTREGLARTCCGENGLIAPSHNVPSNNEMILLFGDSFVEGLHVDDEQKMHQITNHILINSNYNGPFIYNVGMSAQLFADTLWQLPQYLQVYKEKLKAIIVIIMSHDLLYSAKSSQYGAHITINSNTLEIVPPHAAPAISTFDAMKYSFNINAFLYMGKKLLDSYTDWKARTTSHFIHKPSMTSSKAAMPVIDQLTYIEWQLQKLRSLTNLPILFINCVDKPSRSTSGIEPVMQDSDLSICLHDLSLKYDIEYMSLREAFNQLHRNHFIVCGFPNTLPGEGHFSIYAHKLIGNEIAQWCKRNFQSQGY